MILARKCYVSIADVLLKFYINGYERLNQFSSSQHRDEEWIEEQSLERSSRESVNTQATLSGKKKISFFFARQTFCITRNLVSWLAVLIGLMLNIGQIRIEYR